MKSINTQPQLAQEGVAFTVNVDSLTHECIVTHDALHKLAELKSIDHDDSNAMEIFHAHEAIINGVARRLVGAGVQGNPLVMRSATFCAPRTP